MGRWKLGDNGGYYDPNDSGPDQFAPSQAQQANVQAPQIADPATTPDGAGGYMPNADPNTRARLDSESQGYGYGGRKPDAPQVVDIAPGADGQFGWPGADGKSGTGDLAALLTFLKGHFGGGLKAPTGAPDMTQPSQMSSGIGSQITKSLPTSPMAGSIAATTPVVGQMGKAAGGALKSIGRFGLF